MVMFLFEMSDVVFLIGDLSSVYELVMFVGILVVIFVSEIEESELVELVLFCGMLYGFSLWFMN